MLCVFSVIIMCCVFCVWRLVVVFSVVLGELIVCVVSSVVLVLFGIR